MQAIGARVQEVASRGDRVAILAPQGLDYVAGFFAAVKAGTIAVPLFAPELQGHAERLETALTDARPTAVMTTAAAADAVRSFLANLAFARTMPVITIDDVPDAAADAFATRRSRRRRRLAPAVHVGLDAAAGRRRDHPPRSRNQPAADDPVHRSARPKHPRCQLASAVPRHGVVDDRLSGGVRRPFDADVANGLHSSAAALDPGAVGRVAAGTRGHRGTELRLRVHRAAWPACARRGCRPQQCRDDHRFGAGQHGRHHDVQRRVRAVRIAADSDQTVVRNRRSDPVRVDHRPHRPRDGRLPRSWTPCTWSGRTRRRGRRKRCRTGVVRSGGS